MAATLERPDVAVLNDADAFETGLLREALIGSVSHEQHRSPPSRRGDRLEPAAEVARDERLNLLAGVVRDESEVQQ
jgi:hypothetical protein